MRELTLAVVLASLLALIGRSVTRRFASGPDDWYGRLPRDAGRG